jgi:hypothetical protein
MVESLFFSFLTLARNLGWWHSFSHGCC